MKPIPSRSSCRWGARTRCDELFEAARPRLRGPLRLVLDRELVVAIECPRCRWRGEVMRPRVKVKAAEAICPNCNEPARPEFVSARRRRFAAGGRTAFPRRHSPLRYREGRRGGRIGLLPPGRRPGGAQHGVGIRPLSGDDITFGEMSVREPERRQRPDRDRQFRLSGL